MIELLQKFIDQLKEFLTWWVILTPWEKGIRVRFGKNVKLLDSGIYFKIPVFDQVYKQTIRTRNISNSIQTVSTNDGTAISIGLIIQYSINDIFKLYNTLYHPEFTIQNMILSKISKHITQNALKDCNPNTLNGVIKDLDLSQYGIVLEDVGVSTYAVVKTYRLIQDSSWVYEGYNLNNSANT